MRILTTILLIVANSQAQVSSILPGRTTEPPNVLSLTEEKPFQYESVDPDFWSEIKTAMDEQNYTKMVVLAAEVIEDEKNSSTDEAEEARLALGMGLVRMNISYGASVIFSELAKSRNGTKIGEAALYELSLLAQSHYYEKEDIGEDLLVSNEFAPYHSEVESFIGFHAGIYDLTHGLTEWADREFKKVKIGTYWDYQLRYLKAIGEIARDRFDSGMKMLDELRLDEKTPADIKQKSTLQVARLKFEQGDYRTAHDYYYGLNVPVREKARIYLERAWAKFYLKDYSKTLGLLAVANTPVFNASATPERYVLEMLTYRELCHYESVQDAAARFREEFGGALKAIRERGALEKVPVIANMIFVNERYQYWVNFINQIRSEKSDLKDYSWDKYPFYKKLVALYASKDQQVQERLMRDADDRARKVAEEILDAEEQITFLDYTAKLDELRIVRKGENRNYSSEKISYLTFDKMFWPIEKEHWIDELEDYTMLIRSRCGESQLAPRTEAEEEFK